VDISNASYELFKIIMAYEDLTDRDWEGARLALHGTFQGVDLAPSSVGELGEILKFLAHHLCLQGEGEDHRNSIGFALKGIVIRSGSYRADPLTVKWVANLNRTRPSFVNGVRSMMRPGNSFTHRLYTTGLIALTSDQWFDSPIPVMKPEEMSEFCEHLAVFVVNDHFHREFVQRCSVIILLGMLRSPEWRKYIVTRFWRMLAYCTLVDEECESFEWCLRNAMEILAFTRELRDGEGLKWWYGTLWFHYDKLDTTVRDEVGVIAKDMLLGDGLSDLNLYLNLIGQEVVKVRQELDEVRKAARPDLPGVEHSARLRLVALEGNYDRLARITGGRL